MEMDDEEVQKLSALLDELALNLNTLAEKVEVRNIASRRRPKLSAVSRPTPITGLRVMGIPRPRSASAIHVSHSAPSMKISFDEVDGSDDSDSTAVFYEEMGNDSPPKAKNRIPRNSGTNATENRIEETANKLKEIGNDIQVRYGPEKFDISSKIKAEVQERLQQSIRRAREAVFSAADDEENRKLLATVLSTLRTQLQLSVF